MKVVSIALIIERKKDDLLSCYKDNMSAITANELKTQGVSALERALREDQEAVISVRGKPRYVVMEIAHYDELREAELYAAWQQARTAVERGEYSAESAAEHIARLTGGQSEDGV